VSIALVCCRRKVIEDDQRHEVYARVEDIAKMLSGLKRVGGAPSRLAARGSRLENG
jgi:hypothetical protein